MNAVNPMSPGPSAARAAVGASAANERTTLAWQRTALSLVVAACVLGRLTWQDLGLVTLVPLSLAAALGSWVWWASRSRYLDRRRESGRSSSLQGGRSAAALTLGVVLIALTETVSILR